MLIKRDNINLEKDELVITQCVMDGNKKIKFDSNTISCKIFNEDKEKENKKKWKLLHDSYIVLKYKVMANNDKKGNFFYKEFLFF